MLNKLISSILILGSLQTPIQKDIIIYDHIPNSKIELVAEYQLSGQVIAIGERSDVISDLIPIDITMVTGQLNANNTQATQNGRFAEWTTTATDNLQYIYTNLYNTHVIPETEYIKKHIQTISVGDYVKLKGYLANAYLDTENGKVYMKSSLTREDNVCEVMFVKEVLIIKSINIQD